MTEVSIEPFANAHLQREAPVTRNECERALLLRPGGRYLTQ